ncbi:MAG TPA: type II toxin-antitoxin system prevent-host-death family antitoxin [Pseudonocardiaceae bacterium]|nr:type II toxin-antitoxin system prevent-host-death family antitoxin [Pseudonocardiaceae bacterium]
MSLEMSLSEARAQLPDVTNRAEYAGETVYITKHGRRTSAVVPAAAAQLLEDLEDLVDINAVQEALAELDAGRDQPRPFVRRSQPGGSVD